MTNPTEFQPFRLLNEDGPAPLIITGDHAGRIVPPGYGDLGLPAEDFNRHIAWDIGVAGVVTALSEKLNAPAAMANFTRLFIDTNRGDDDPTLVMKLSDGAIIPGNRDVDAAEVERRKALCTTPYHQAITGLIDRKLADGPPPAILSIHSFTPEFKGHERPWRGALLWDKDDRLARPLIDALSKLTGYPIGDNEPYDGALKNDAMYRHGTARGLPHALIEIRQDEIGEADGQARWADKIATAMGPLLGRADIHEIKHFGSRTDQL